MPLSTDRSLRSFLQSRAQDLGFNLVGVTTPAPPPHYAVFESWLSAGRHGEMAYLASDRSRQRRADPLQALPSARSIVVLAAPYAPATPMAAQTSEPGELRGQVAAYAWGLDYHEALVEKLRRLAQALQAASGCQAVFRAYSDAGPVLERDLAQRAGLGWIGKNTCLIHPRQGSYFFLAELFLDLELAPDPPFEADHCGSCTRCLEACPTGCIRPDRTLDARRCISYWTIELKGPIPRAERPLLGAWVFGCDLCQQVCPWNQRFAGQVQPLPEFAPRPGLSRPDLLAELRLGVQEFNRKFRRSPLQRARRRGYLRNVAVVLGNLGDPRAIPALHAILENEPEPLVRGHAAWALGRLGASAALEQRRNHEADPYVQSEIEWALVGGETK